MFKNNSYYHPIFNNEFNSLTQKELFIFHFSSNISKINNTKILRKCRALCKLPKFSFFKTKIHHAFFHGAQAYLFFSFSEKNIFNSPKRDLINNNNNINNKDINNNIKNIKNIFNTDSNKNNLIGANIQYPKECEIFEQLLYNRIVNTLNLKESIYILAKKNYDKDIKTFRNDFINLKQKSIEKLFLEAIEDNSETLLKIAYEEYLKLSIKNKKFIENYQWTYNGNYNIDLENVNIESIRNDHSKLKQFHQKRNKKFYKK